MNIFISCFHIDIGLALKLSSVLEADGYDVFSENKIPIGNNTTPGVEKKNKNDSGSVLIAFGPVLGVMLPAPGPMLALAALRRVMGT